MYEVFISYSHKDQKIADAICNHLESSNLRCWIAPRDINPGGIWASEIALGLSKCKILVLVFSENSNLSKQVLREVELSINNGLILVPFKIDTAKPSGGMEYYLSTTHWIDLVNETFEHQMDILFDKVSAVLEGNLKEIVNKNDKGVVKSTGKYLRKKFLLILLSIAIIVPATFLVYRIVDGLFMFEEEVLPLADIYSIRTSTSYEIFDFENKNEILTDSEFVRSEYTSNKRNNYLISDIYESFDEEYYYFKFEINTSDVLIINLFMTENFFSESSEIYPGMHTVLLRIRKDYYESSFQNLGISLLEKGQPEGNRDLYEIGYDFPTTKITDLSYPLTYVNDFDHNTHSFEELDYHVFGFDGYEDVSKLPFEICEVYGMDSAKHIMLPLQVLEDDEFFYFRILLEFDKPFRITVGSDFIVESSTIKEGSHTVIFRISKDDYSSSIDPIFVEVRGARELPDDVERIFIQLNNL